VLSFINFNAQNSSNEVAKFLSNHSNKIYSEKSGYYFTDVPSKKNFKERLSGEIEIDDTATLNFNKLNIQFEMDDYRYYLVKNHNLLLVLKSIDHIKIALSNEK
jgi:hypothetical protein